MRVLFMTSESRFWQHLIPLAVHMRDAGHDVHVEDVLTQRDPLVDNPLHARSLFQEHHYCPADDPVNIRVWLADILWPTQWDAVVLCAEHLPVLRWVKTILRAGGNPAPVFSMQHGLSQRFETESRDYCDHMLIWGHFSHAIFATSGPRHVIPYTVTGSPRFDSYRAADAEDKGFILACAAPREITPEYLRALSDCFPAEQHVFIKVHPTDLTPVKQSDRFEFIPTHENPHEYLRTCHALYITYLSTYWLEAKCFGKPIVADGRDKDILELTPFNSLLLPGDACPRIRETIEQIVYERSNQ